MEHDLGNAKRELIHESLTVDIQYMYSKTYIIRPPLGFRGQVIVIPAKGYRNVGIPETMYTSVEKIIEKNKDLYRNPSEFIVDATRRLVREFKG